MDTQLKVKSKFRRYVVNALVLMTVVLILLFLYILFAPPPMWYIRGRVANGIALMGPLEKAIEQYYIRHNKFPEDDSMVRFAIPTDFKGTGISNVIIETQDAGVRPQALITMAYDRSVDKGKTLILSTIAPQTGEKFVWDCKGGTLFAGQRPPECYY